MTTETKSKLSDLEHIVLSALCACENGKGTPLSKPYQRTGSRLIGRGFAYSVGFGNFHVFIATDEGRKAFDQATQNDRLRKEVITNIRQTNKA